MSESPGDRVVVVMPAYNAAKTLERTYADIPAGVVDRVIVVDDVSQDETVEIARRLGLEVVIHIQNRGYGGNQKTCYLRALGWSYALMIAIILIPPLFTVTRYIPPLPLAPLPRYLVLAFPAFIELGRVNLRAPLVFALALLSLLIQTLLLIAFAHWVFIA